MSVVSALHRVLVEALIGLAGADRRGSPRGEGDGDRGFMLVCKKCAQRVYVRRNKPPDGIERGCDCGHVTTVNWRKTTDQLSGKPCSQEQLSRPVDQDLLGCGVDGLAVGSFDELAGFEAGSGADEGDEVGCVHRPPAVLGGFDELERHRQASGSRTRALGDLGAVPDGREGRLGFVVRRWIQCSAG